MKNIAIIAPTLLPIPASKGGAIETLVTQMLDENEKRPLAHYTVFSFYDAQAEKLSAGYKNASFVFMPAFLWEQLPVRAYNVLHYAWWRLQKGRTAFMDYSIRAICKAMRGRNFDAVLVEGNYRQVKAICQMGFKHVVVHLHADWLSSQTLFGSEYAAGCEKIIAVSDYIKNRVQTLPEAKNVVTVYNCVDTQIFDKEPYAAFRRKFRLEHGIKPDEVLLIFCGRVDETKGIDKLVEALGRLQNQTVKLLVVGGAWFSDETSTPFIQKLKAESKPLENRIIFTGYVPYETVPGYYACGDIAVLPSVCYEAGNLTAFEAQAMSLPLVITNRGGTPESVTEQTAVMVSADIDLAANLTQALDPLVADEEKRRRMGAAGRENALRFTVQAYHENLYREITGEK